MVAINNQLGEPIYLGRAKAGTLLSDDKWQIRKITYDGNDGIIRLEWPQDVDGNASCEYEFVWSSVSDLTITGISQAATAVVTVAAIGSLMNGDTIVITDVEGMTEVNFDGTNLYTVANIAGNTFELFGINSLGFTAYTGGGTAGFGEVLTYTYS
jgi:hypothetical protein